MRQTVTLQKLLKTDADIYEAKQRGQYTAALVLQRKRDAMAGAIDKNGNKKASQKNR